jgi:hypothetical protein
MRPIWPSLAHSRSSSSSGRHHQRRRELTAHRPASPPLPETAPHPPRLHSPLAPSFPLPSVPNQSRKRHPIEAPPSRHRLLLDRPPPIAPRPIKGPYISAIFHRVQSRSRLCLSPARASCRRKRLATGVGPHRRSLSLPVPPTADHGEDPLGPFFL